MPELPEVETVLQGLRPLVKGHCLRDIVIRQKALRWRIPEEIKKQFPKQLIYDLQRRGKYLLFITHKGTAILHLGMSGSLAFVHKDVKAEKHDHFDLIFDEFTLRYTDPRRFGALLWTTDDPESHPLLAHLGPEPLTKNFDGAYLHKKAAHKKVGIKQFIMNSRIVVGVGNIYAAEALFAAKIHPLLPAKNLSQADCDRLAIAIKKVLLSAIKQGGTTLRNFLNTTGKPGYFKQKLNVYGREGLACNRCKTKLRGIRIQNRATVFCPMCQPER